MNDFLGILTMDRANFVYFVLEKLTNVFAIIDDFFILVRSFEVESPYLTQKKKHCVYGVGILVLKLGDSIRDCTVLKHLIVYILKLL